MKNSEESELRELLWRSNLTQAEEARVRQLVAAQADAKAVFDEELHLNQTLNRLPDAPLASNFTAQVMRAVEVENLKNSREKRVTPAWRVGFGWVSRLAMAGFLIVAGLFTFKQHQAAQHAELRHSVASLSTVGAMPVEWLENFDTIKNLDAASAVDDELLAALR